MWKFFLLSFIFVIVAVFIQQDDIHIMPSAQSQKLDVVSKSEKTYSANQAKVGSEKIYSANQAKVEGSFQIAEMTDTSLEKVLAQSIPSIWFVFPCNEDNIKKELCKEESLKIEIPEETQKSLKNFWKDALTFRYNINIRKDELNGEKYYQQTKAFFVTSSSFAKYLEEIAINTPDGKRKISPDEANDVVYFINTASMKVIEQVEALKEQNK
jgi:hypothetical protein